jgi:hypothetical protein
MPNISELKSKKIDQWSGKQHHALGIINKPTQILKKGSRSKLFAQGRKKGSKAGSATLGPGIEYRWNSPKSKLF